MHRCPAPQPDRRGAFDGRDAGHTIAHMDQPDLTRPPNLQEGLERVLREFLASLPGAGALPLAELAHALAAQPEGLRQLQQRFVQDQQALWTGLAAAEGAAARPPAAGDRRFASADWDALPFFRMLKESYLINARWLDELIALARLPPPAQRRARFVARQIADAMAPTNTPWTNPDALRLAAQTGGASLENGIRNLAHDLAQGRIAMSAAGAFEVGRNVAVTPGAVVFENDVAQLIQYLPRTPKVRARPLLIVPPFINKYYLLDLQPHNSFVRFALDQGLQVFIVSWRNAGAAQAHRTWDDYVREGVLAPLEAVLEITRSRTLNALGFCVGGTLLATALATMERPERVHSLTLLACLLDFSDVGDIAVYVDRDYVEGCERQYAQGGVMPGARIAAAFASLRPTDLVWSFVVNNYLKGREPPAFDLLAWNSDSANLPGPLFAWYLRHLYLENRLRVPGGLHVLGRPVDLTRVRMPAYVMAAQDDHIVPWTSAFASTQLLGGHTQFVLSASGHVAGVVNPPGSGRRYFRAGAPPSADAQAWIAGAVRHEGSWWDHWAAWAVAHSGRAVRAPASPGSTAHPVVEAAPGRYVTEVPALEAIG